MNTYVILRNVDHTEMSLLESEAYDLPKNKQLHMDVDGRLMIKVLEFDAPSWEAAKTIYEWTMAIRPKATAGRKRWKEVKLMAESTSRHVSPRKSRPES